MDGSVSFDRAAGFYDETRKLSPRVAMAITDALIEELESAGADRLLEIGIGTGRIARPLMERGVRVTGVDVSPLMLARLTEQLTGSHTAPDIMLGDATLLPFRDRTFPAALAVHVFHLVSSPETATTEVRRVLQSGGMLLHQTHKDTESLIPSSDKWDAMLAERGLTMPVRSTFADSYALLEATGALVTRRRLISEESTLDPARVLDETKRKLHSWTWRIPGDIFDDCMPGYEAWFRGYYGDRPIHETVTYILDVWRWADE